MFKSVAGQATTVLAGGDFTTGQVASAYRVYRFEPGTGGAAVVQRLLEEAKEAFPNAGAETLTVVDPDATAPPPLTATGLADAGKYGLRRGVLPPTSHPKQSRACLDALDVLRDDAHKTVRELAPQDLPSYEFAYTADGAALMRLPWFSALLRGASKAWKTQLAACV